MSTTSTVLDSGIRELARNRWMLAYATGFFVLTESLFWFQGTGPQVLLSLLNVLLLVIPLVSLVFGAMYIYSSREFIELLLAQPIARRDLFLGHFMGLALPLAGAFAVGAGLPFALHAGAGAGFGGVAVLLSAGIGLSVACAAIAVAIALYSDDRLRGVGMAIGAWLLLTVLYDAGLLAIAVSFDAWPLEKPMIALMMANPVDIARGLVLTQLDAPAMMGYTGALFRRSFGSALGTVIAATALAIWIAAPFAIAGRRFRRRDF
ncbi:MAG: ABC transporter permease subunit [Gemmatimonadaceae bacterium]|nr:ABC transporter permease subunit [Gemmatimonadaceae bacterium]